ncbi:kinase [Nocardiopsis sp. HNM0947]|uniref:Kinase n=1 Tax=Nocardiopsis coralli TaxID=2772213 RepID=A0ABR9P9S8_9ACTN|nr:AAA family ATPase [Nocardiopsis coralli]MBE3000597.1 kinase [Nocardiopsis coralli]
MNAAEGSCLVVLRGNSASGKSTTAHALREAHGRGMALVEQDHLRRTLLWEKDRPGAANIGLIDLTVRHALAHGYHVVLEGILRADHYGAMLTSLARDHPGRTRAYYFDLPFDVTLERHSNKALAAEFGEPVLRRWWRHHDLVPGLGETTIDRHWTVEGAVARILHDCGLHALHDP